MENRQVGIKKFSLRKIFVDRNLRVIRELHVGAKCFQNLKNSLVFKYNIKYDLTLYLI